MKYNLFLTFAATVAAAGIAAPARADVYSVDFSGLVYQTNGTTPSAVGDTISGELTLIGDPGVIASFTIDGTSAPSGASSSATITPFPTDAIYQSQVSAVSTGGNLNESLTLDLSSLTTWPTTDDASTLLADVLQLTTNLDTGGALSSFPSTFGYYIGDASGNVTGAESAYLTSVSVAVPEPASLALLAVSMLGLGAVRRRRG